MQSLQQDVVKIVGTFAIVIAKIVYYKTEDQGQDVFIEMLL